MKMLRMVTNDGTLKNNYFSTRYSTINNTRLYSKSRSQMKNREYYKQNNRRYIENMYRSDNYFKYEPNPTYRGTHRAHLQTIENRVRKIIPELDFEKNKLQIFNTQCISLRNEFKSEYRILRRDMIEEVDKLESKIAPQFNRQKIENQRLKQEIRGLNKDLLDIKNNIVELKRRIASLKLRID